VRDAELGLRAVLGGPAPILADGHALLDLEPRDLVLSACKPADDGDGVVVRMLNPSGASREAVLTLGFDADDVVGVRLDETPSGEPVARDGRVVRLAVPPHALRSVRISGLQAQPSPLSAPSAPGASRLPSPFPVAVASDGSYPASGGAGYLRR
jgi:hypothetical protein